MEPSFWTPEICQTDLYENSRDSNMVCMNQDSGIQSASSSCWPTATPSSASSVFEGYAPQQCLMPPPQPSPPQPQQQPQVHARQLSQPPQLPDIATSKVVQEFEEIMDLNDEVVLTNSVCLLFRFSIDSVRGLEICQAMSASPAIMKILYHVLLSPKFKEHDLILCYATGNLTNISKYEQGKAAILGYDPQISNEVQFRCSPGVESLIRSLQSKDSNVVIFAITAIHNLLLDRRTALQEIAKQQIKHGIQYIVQLLDNQYLKHNYEFKVIVLDCLQILAYGNNENRLAIKNSRGAYLLLRTIGENFDNQPTEELIETASRVLKSLSACPANKIDIINDRGISILTHCITKNNHEILKTCLWTLRNLSDVINNSERENDNCIIQLVERLLQILDEYAEEPCIITCALGILANLTCNNEAIKQFICDNNGIDLMLNTIAIALRDGPDFGMEFDQERLEPAICTLCHLMNQSSKEVAERARVRIAHSFEINSMFNAFMRHTRKTNDDLTKAVQKLFNLTSKPSQVM